MNGKTIIPMLLVMIAMQGMAIEPITLTPFVSESRANLVLNDTVDPPPAKIHGSVFAAMPGFVSYTFSQNSLYYTPALMGGFDLSYKKFILEGAALVGKENSFGLAAVMIYSLRAKQLDEGWGSSTGIMGEYAYFPSQQGNPDMSSYTLGICHMFFRPYQWGLTGIGFLLGGSYMNDAFSLNARMALIVSIPVF